MTSKPLGPLQRRVLDVLRSGGWVTGPDLYEAAFGDVSYDSVQACIGRLRQRGYEIRGCNQRGFRLVGGAPV